jgi:hypothetical protein
LWWPTALTAAVLCWVAFSAGGGLRLAQMTTVEIVLTIGSGVVVACAVLFRPERRLERADSSRTYGLWSAGLLLAFAALAALSVVWSVQPDESWQDAGRMFAYSAVFAASLMLVRIAPERWPAVLGGVVLAAVVVCGYALLTKVFPGQLDANDIYARLRAPYDYWNAIGLTAAMGVVSCLWLGARRAGHAVLSALAYPAAGLMLVTLLLAYSRGALVALALGLLLWFSIVPLRLRGAAVLLTAALGAGVVVAWDFSKHALSSENISLAARTAAGRQLGVLLVAMLLALTIAGLAIGFRTSWRAPSRTTRRRAGALLLILSLLACLALGGALTVSRRGFTGTISHDVSSLTNPNAKIPSNTPGRLTAIASVRARYWNEALKIFKDHPALGAGAGAYRTARLRYRTETLDVRHAHGYVVQTLADLGLVGLLLTLALLAAWMAAAGRSTHPFNRRWTSWRELRGESGGASPERANSSEGADETRARPRAQWRRLGWRYRPMPYTAERIGMLTMLCVVVVFGVHSLVDWTWYVPGNACVALLCAGWLAGRGPIEAKIDDRLRDLQDGLVEGSDRAPAAAAAHGASDASTGASPTTGAGVEPSGTTAPGVEPSGTTAPGADSSGTTAPGADSSGTPAPGADSSGTTAPGADPSGRRIPAVRTDPRSLAIACAALIGALLAAWAQWLPLRSEDAAQEALTLIQRNPARALAAAHLAVDRDPLSVQARFTLAKVQQQTGQAALGKATLEQAVRLQPSNPQTWVALGEYDLTRDPEAALGDLHAAIYLNPESIAPELVADGNPEAITIQNDYVEALRATGSSATAGTAILPSGP